VLAGAELVAFLPTVDADRARRFFEDVVGLPLLEQTPFACVFQAPNAVLRVTVVPELTAAQYTVLGWRVPDVQAAARELGERGIEPLRYDGMTQDQLGIWQAPSGARVLWFSDPDGNVLSLTQV
jgi:catechol 2,3-dioxygenase-like lactoylglutathione lyase family enzyme